LPAGTAKLIRGGRSWNYFVPYQSDAGAALQRLRGETFRTGQYAHSRAPFSEEELEELPELAEEEPLKEPETIEELLEQEGEDGTNSILDITHISERPEFAAVCPMPAESLREIFGTDRPTHEMVDSKLGYSELSDHPLTNEKWQGAYFTVHRAGKPDEICFLGISGDH